MTENCSNDSCPCRGPNLLAGGFTASPQQWEWELLTRTIEALVAQVGTLEEKVKALEERDGYTGWKRGI